MNLREITDQSEWDGIIQNHPYGHPLQLWAWGELKRHNGWQPIRLAGKDAAAQLLLWPIPRLGKNITYVPRGPVAEPSTKPAVEMLAELVKAAKQNNALFLKIEPAWKTADLPRGWRPAKEQIVLAETYTVDLTKPNEQLESAMRSKTRQYIRQAERNNLKLQRVDASGDLSDFWRIYKDTAARAGFGIHALDYYRQLHQLFGDNSYLYYATQDGQAEAFLWLIAGAGTALELYGGVTKDGGDAKANYLLKSHAIREMKSAGLKLYDFSGRLNEGVSQFKAGFGPDETDYIGSYDYVFNQLGYGLWTGLLPALKPFGRKFLKRGIVK